MPSPSSGIQVDPGSFRDPSGFVFYRDGVVFRQVNQFYRPHYDRFMSSGLYDRLAEAGLILRHDEQPMEDFGDGPELDPEAYKILKPRPLELFSYPFEWCFSQLQDAALATLRIQRTALEFGLSLKDASAYNFQFVDGEPVLIDTLSVEVYEEGQPWVAYGQFCRHFLAPLALMAFRDVRLGSLLRRYLDGVPLDLATRLLPSRCWLRPGLLVHLRLHARSLNKAAAEPTRLPRRRIRKHELLGLLDNLNATVRRLKWSPEGTAWADYYEETNYSAVAMSSKTAIVTSYLERTRPRIVLDLGANTGRFSRVAAKTGAATIACDADPAAVERTYLRCRQDQEALILPLWIDLDNPSPGIGWAGLERRSFAQRMAADLVLGLALIHHLAIGNNVPLESVARFLSTLGTMSIVEFVPKSDSQLQRMLASRKDIFNRYHRAGFESAFSRHFAIEEAREVSDSERVLYLMRSRREPAVGQLAPHS